MADKEVNDIYTSTEEIEFPGGAYIVLDGTGLMRQRGRDQDLDRGLTRSHSSILRMRQLSLLWLDIADQEGTARR